MKNIRYGLIAIATSLLIYCFNWANIFNYQNNHNLTHRAFAQQRLTPEIIAEMIYEENPDIPKENNYQSSNTGEIATQNTLISRFVRYHQFVKSRPVAFRLDWKLTFADYLGYNETIREENYPGFRTLTENPFTRDKEIINSLSKQQRDKLVDTLASIHQPTSPSTPSQQNSPPESSSTPSFVLPQKGGADLLLPSP